MFWKWQDKYYSYFISLEGKAKEVEIFAHVHGYYVTEPILFGSHLF